MSNFGSNIRPGSNLLCAFVGSERHGDGNVTVGVAVGLNAGSLNPLHPGVKVVLRLRDVAAVWRIAAGIGLAQRHSALGEGAVDGVFGGRAETNPGVAEAGGDAIFD